MIPKILYAKSQRLSSDVQVTLLDHTLHVLRCVDRIFAPCSRMASNWGRFFKIDKSQFESFLLHLRVAACLHDIGKANSDFQTSVTSKEFKGQTFRHEHISALMLFAPEMKKWLISSRELESRLDLDVVAAAVLSHHLKASSKADDSTGWCFASKERSEVETYFYHSDVRAILSHLGEIASLTGDLPSLAFPTFGTVEPFEIVFRRAIDQAMRMTLKIAKLPEQNGLLLAVKAGLIVADAAGSGLVRTGKSIETWIDSTLHQASITSELLEKSILQPRARQVAKRTGKTFQFRDFQQNIGDQGNRVLLLASCAAGKTLAGWKWAQRMCDQHQIGKVIFLYPTRGTATEGFRDYVGWAPETEMGLDHGSSLYELEAIQANPPESLKGKTVARSIDEDRLFALGLWGKRYLSATVDQFLGFMEHQYNSLCKLPMLTDSLLVIDEIHSFDAKMFGVLIAFLSQFDAHVLCMTATLPQGRRSQLEEVGLKVYTAEEDELLQHQSKVPRYLHHSLSGENEAFDIAAWAVRKGKRVLWVVNVVDRCQAIADRLAKELNREVLSYHGRFKLADRQTVHHRTVEAFQQESDPVIAVTTQVCEMSLDLDAQVLITEYAPVPSIVQRFGRANRHLREDHAEVYTYPTSGTLPYDREEIAQASAFLAEVGNRLVSQAELSELLEKHTANEVKVSKAASFVSGGYFAVAGEFRDIDEFTLPCLLDDENELSDVKALLDARKPIDGFVVNVPRPDKLFPELNANRPAWIPHYLYLADHRQYDSFRGFKKQIGGEGQW